MAEKRSPIAGLRCLVLDDEFLIALDVQQILESAGAASVLSVTSAQDVFDALNKGAQFDLAAVDINLGEKNNSGLSVARVLAKHQTPFVFLTGLQSKAVQDDEFPHVPVVEKPYQTAALLEALMRALYTR